MADDLLLGDGIRSLPGDGTSLNLTPHETGLKGYSYEDFWKVIDSGTRKDGRKLDPFMPFESLRKMDDIERRALFAFLSQLPPKVYGDR